MNEATAVETPSGKTASDENFPVVTRILPARLRSHIATFYAYARAIDDIADNPELDPDDKIERLDGFAKAVSGVGSMNPAFRKAYELSRSLAATRVTDRHCVDLVQAFKQDATKLRYDNWDDLISYCNLSAAPVGRYLVDLHGESTKVYPASDALCNALQVLNHVQDCQDDYKDLNRVYLPGNWMNEAGVDVNTLNGKRSTKALRRVFDLCLDATDGLLDVAARLPGRIRIRVSPWMRPWLSRFARKLSANCAGGCQSRSGSYYQDQYAAVADTARRGCSKRIPSTTPERLAHAIPVAASATPYFTPPKPSVSPIPPFPDPAP